MDDKQRIALVETRTLDTAATTRRHDNSIRYQFGNHLGSASLELDEQAQIISYEEYTPYGSSTYQAVRSQTETPKRYRYTGKERDEESGLYFHEARYYAPFLGRWTAADPIGMRAGVNAYRYCRNAPINLSDPTGQDPPDDQPPYRLRPLLSDVSVTGVSGSFQFHDLLSSDRSVSGNGGIGFAGRAGFLLDVPRLNLSTSGFVDASALAAVDTDRGAAGVRLRGGAVVGDLSGLHLAVTGAAAIRVPVPERLRLGDLPAPLLDAVPRGEGAGQLSGGLSYGSVPLARFRASASLAGGSFEGRLDATSVGDVARLRADVAGSVGATGDITLQSARLQANVDLPGLNVGLGATGTATSSGALALSASGDIRLLGLPSLHLEGSGSASTTGVDLSGRFYGPGPLFTSYISGSFDLSTNRGISARAGVIGLTYTPGINISDPAPPSPGLSAVAGPARNPWTPSGLTLGASYFQDAQGQLTHVSAGFIPELNERIFTNPRFGVTAGVHF